MKLYYKLTYMAAFAVMPLLSIGQTKEKPIPNWQNLDLKTDNVFGISTERAYSELLKGKPSSNVIVAVIDGGVDQKHEDLKDVIWVNSKEIAGNGKDDDNNGYIDDINGWSFLGSPKGNVKFDNLESVRLIRKYQNKYAAILNSSPLSVQERKEFNLYRKLNTEYMEKLQNARMGNESLTTIMRTIDTIENKIGISPVTASDIYAYNPKGDIESKIIKILKSELKKEPDYSKVRADLKEASDYYYNRLNYHLNIDFDPRDSIGDNYSDSRQRTYGNNDVKGPDALHGTHVSGIIGAMRLNNLGIKGIANNIKIISIRAVPDGDERDKDVANAIRYAVDNGAKVINMSFGKSYSWDKAIVDSAVEYASSKDVLLIHAAGNDAENNDISNNFPTRFYGDSTDANFWNLNKGIEKEQQILQSQIDERIQGNGGRVAGSLSIDSDKLASINNARPQARNWIEVGASSWLDNEDLVAEFSNYGHSTVDVFAPGVKINSTVTDSKYKEEDGTSMASPVVAGLAALLRSYYPKLSAVQIKDIITNSVTKVDHKVKIREEGRSKRVYLKDISVSGGIVNAYSALLLAEKTAAISTAIVPKMN